MDLVTLTEYKAYQSITNPTEDALNTSIITKASALVKTYCRRTFVDWVSTNKVEIYNGGDKYLYLQELPLVQLVSVEQSTDYGQTWTALTQYTDWIWNQQDERLVNITDYNEWLYLENGYRVTYKAGYASVPEDLKLAVMDLVTYYRRNDGAIHSTKGPGSNSVQIEYISTTNLPAHIKRVLDLYCLNYN
jgi:hypothetical protein